MGRPKETDTNEAVNPEAVENEVVQTAPEVNEAPKVEDTEEVNEIPAPQKQFLSKPEAKEDLPANVVEKMRLYPQYEELWITSRGFVHPLGVPQYILKDAKRYKNIFYNK